MLTFGVFEVVEVVDGLVFTIAMGLLAVVAEGRQEKGAVGDVGSVAGVLGKPGHEGMVALRPATDQAEEIVFRAPGFELAGRRSLIVHEGDGSFAGKAS